MKTPFRRGIPTKTILLVLAFLLVMQPLAPVFADEASGLQQESTIHDPAGSGLENSFKEALPNSDEEGAKEAISEDLAESLLEPNEASEEESEQIEEGETAPQSAMSMSLAGGVVPQSGSLPSTIKQATPSSEQISGALAYSYPITVSPGRNGMQPDLKLVYNSQGGEEGKYFGKGWAVNIPSIERVNKKGVNSLYSDNFFSSSLSGELLSLGSGLYGARVENGEFLKYELSGNAWIVTDKKGVKYKFGTAAASRQDNPSDSTKVFKWMLDEVRDRNDNYVKYEYYKDQGQIYPSKVIYTGSGSTDGIFEVEFVRESRSDELVSAKAGFKVETAYRINEINTKVNNSWVRKYALAYSNSDNGQSLVLNTITESGRNDAGATVALPAEDYDYHQPNNSPAMWDSPSWTVPVDTRNGVVVSDVNGDSLADVIQSYNGGGGPSNIFQRTWLNNGAGWTLSSDFVTPFVFWDSPASIKDQGARLLDVNGDGLADIIQKQESGATSSYLNNGTGWTSTTDWQAPMPFVYYNSSDDTGVEIGDYNGDGLADFIKGIKDPGTPTNITPYVYLNNGVNGWTSNGSWVVPVDTREGVVTADINGDGLDDLVQAYSCSCGTSPKKAWINNGDGTWTLDTNYAPPMFFWADSSPYDEGVRMYDFNGDGLTDIAQNKGGFYSVTTAYINTGTGWSEVTSGVFNPAFNFANGSNGADTGVRMGDVNGDGLSDLVLNNGTEYVRVNNKKRADILSKTTYPRGGTTEVEYQAAAQYNTSGTLLNPNLPLILNTVKKITNNDGFGLLSTKEYKYEGGKYYYNTAGDRKFAGFMAVTAKDAANNAVKTFNHQGNSSDSSNGEYSDHVSKIGKPYRLEFADSSGNIFRKVINKWENYGLSGSRDFVRLTQSVDFAYDGDSDHKEKAFSYTYDNANGNLTDMVEWGEVSGSNDGTFTDTGTDKFTTTAAYVSSSTYNIYALAYQETTVDQSSGKVREAKYYYDTLSLGSVDKGNPTKEERWKSSTNYIDIERTYNSYGLITESKDPRDKATSYAYDSYNLYPITVTNPLSQDTEYTYDYSSGKIKQTTDLNGRVFESLYDGLDRVVEEKQPDLGTPSTLVTKATYAYGNLSAGASTQKTDYLDGSLTVDTYSYTDGFDRPLQIRKETEDSNTYAVTDFFYNNLEQLHKESLPYSGSGSAKDYQTSTAALLTTYSYDALMRPTTVVNAAGTIAYAYDDWKTSITDARTKVKRLYKDAYGNLAKVEEVNSASTYTTLYEYNGNSNLTKITDALSNLRNFTYDGLGRRLTAQDLHASADTYFGTWTYAYDDSGNLASVTDPKGQVIDYTYDDVDRRLTENYAGQAGTEVTYTYDSGTDGIGRLTSVVAAGANSSYAYNPHGRVKEEAKNINSTDYQTDYTYDRQGNVLEITNPDSSKVKYAYNTAGQLETVQRKESTDGSFIDLITDIDYGPHGKITYQAYANGVDTTNAYDSSELYRLERKYTRKDNGSTTTHHTATFYPSSSAVDGRAGQSYNNGSGQSWSTIVGGAGDFAIHSDTTFDVGFVTDSVTNKFTQVDRGIVMFDTSSLPDGAAVTSATLSVHGAVKSDNLGVQPDINVYSANPASTSSLSASDYSTLGTTVFSTAISYSGFNTSGYNNFALNSSGLGNISKTGVSKFGFKNANYDAANLAPAWSNSAYSFLEMKSYSNSGTSMDPKLVVNYDVYTPNPSTALQDLNYTYDANGNITQIVDDSDTDSSKTVDYVYDDLNRLTSATATSVAAGQSTYTKTYAYDAIGNITAGDAGTYAYAGDQGVSTANPHAVTSTSTGTISYTYDDNGNLLTVTSGLSNAWDYNNRLIQAVKGGVTSTYVYDHNGQRVKMGNGTKTTIYPSPYYNTDGTTHVKHIMTPDGQTIATIKGTGASTSVFSVHTDHLTGSNAITNSSGTQEELLDYFPFGSIRLDQKAGSFDEQRKFTGLEYDVDTGLNYAVNRYYNSSIGRFASQDPSYLAIGDDDQFRQLAKQELQQLLSDPQQLNSYAYARNNPLVNVDPDGNISIRAGLELAGQGLKLAGQYVSYEAKQEWQDYQDFRQASYQWQMEHPKTAELLVNLTLVAGGTVSTKGVSTNGVNKFGQEINSKITEPYQRPPNATTKAQKASVQGRSCVDCGTSAPKMNADHKDPLVKEYYRTGTIDQQKMRDVNSVQPQCPSCSAKQGGVLSNFSRQVKNYLGIK